MSQTPPSPTVAGEARYSDPDLVSAGSLAPATAVNPAAPRIPSARIASATRSAGPRHDGRSTHSRRHHLQTGGRS